jgi:hypothetical protein
MTQHDADAFAAAWIAAWNSHDLNRILEHYAEEVTVTSPLIASVLGNDRDSVRGKAELRSYWGPALVRFPDLKFELYHALPGVRSVVLDYKSVKNLVAAEYMEFDERGKVRRVVAHYRVGEDSE